jgi:hypothetical protein
VKSINPLNPVQKPLGNFRGIVNHISHIVKLITVQRNEYNELRNERIVWELKNATILNIRLFLNSLYSVILNAL